MDVILSFVSASIGALSPCACDPLWVRENLEPLLPERFPHSVVPADELLACQPSQASLCALSHQVAAVVYGVVYVLAVVQLVRFWLMPHKSGTQNVLHWLLVATALTRAVREAVLAVGLDHPLLVPLYFVPSLLMFSNMTVLAMLWYVPFLTPSLWSSRVALCRVVSCECVRHLSSFHVVLARSGTHLTHYREDDSRRLVVVVMMVVVVFFLSGHVCACTTG